MRGRAHRKVMGGVRVVLVLWVALSWGGAEIRAQGHPEPVLDSLRGFLHQPGLDVGVLLQVVVDPSVDRADPEGASTQVAAMRLLLGGSLDGGFSYFFQTNFAGDRSILDARFGWSPSRSLGVYAGRFKVPFSRELLTPAGSIDFVNRARMVTALAPGRQYGVQVGGKLGESLEWSAGGFSGSQNGPRNESLLGAVRMAWTGRPSSAGVGGEGARSWVALSAARGRDAAVAGAALGPDFSGNGTLLGLDARVESGRLLLAAEAIGADWKPESGKHAHAGGLYLTGGWRIRPRAQVLARWDRYEAVGEEGDDALVAGINLWPTTASEIQVNWSAPVGGASLPHKLLVNLQIGF